MPQLDFEVNPQLTGLSLAYQNENYIADLISKRIPVTTRTFKYRKYNKDLNLQLPDTAVGDSSDPEKVKFKSTLEYQTVRGDALLDDIPKVDIDDAKGNAVSLQFDSTEFLTNIFNACREKRLADLLGNPATYNGNSKTLSSSEKISNASSDAVTLISDGMDKCWLPPNTMILSRQAFSALRKNPSIVAGCNRNSGDKGIAKLDDIKELFGLDNIYIGTSVSNTAKRGQQPNFVNLWGNDIILAYINPNAGLTKGLSFIATGEFGTRQISTGFDGKAGVSGVQYVKIAEQLADVILAADCGYLLKSVI